MKRMLVLMAILVAQAIPATAQSREKSLDRWVERDLIPFVQQQLLVHPRFKGETVVFVVLKDSLPAPVSNALALSLRDRVLEAAVDTTGVSIGWQQGRGTGSGAPAGDCSRNRVHYYIGLELTQNLDSSYSVGVRALDLEDRAWVTGFGRSWRGKLNAVQRQAMRQPRVDQTFLGGRDVPFTMAQTDLLAAHLAQELGCLLLQGREQDYIVAADAKPAGDDELAGAVELVSNNLANIEALQLTSDTDEVNADLRGKAHLIDGNLYQYWVTITPKDATGGLAALSTSAYIELPWQDEPAAPQAAAAAQGIAPEKRLVPAARPATISIPNAGKDALLGPISIVDQSSREFSVLRSNARGDAIVFFLAHQANYGLVRLSGSTCRDRTTVLIARSNETLSFPIPSIDARNRNVTETHEWFVEPDVDTYYALAITNSKFARQIANHIDRLPLRCKGSFRPGLSGEELRRWLEELATMMARTASSVDWRGVRVRNVL